MMTLAAAHAFRTTIISVWGLGDVLNVPEFQFQGVKTIFLFSITSKLVTVPHLAA